MGLDLADYEAKARDATMAFWGNRQKALQAKVEAGKTDTGERGAVTAGNTMDGFTALMIDLDNVDTRRVRGVCAGDIVSLDEKVRQQRFAHASLVATNDRCCLQIHGRPLTGGLLQVWTETILSATLASRT